MYFGKKERIKNELDFQEYFLTSKLNTENYTALLPQGENSDIAQDVYHTCTSKLSLQCKHVKLLSIQG